MSSVSVVINVFLKIMNTAASAIIVTAIVAGKDTLVGNAIITTVATKTTVAATFVTVENAIVVTTKSSGLAGIERLTVAIVTIAVTRNVTGIAALVGETAIVTDVVGVENAVVATTKAAVVTWATESTGLAGVERTTFAIVVMVVIVEGRICVRALVGPNRIVLLWSAADVTVVILVGVIVIVMVFCVEMLVLPRALKNNLIFWQVVVIMVINYLLVPPETIAVVVAAVVVNMILPILHLTLIHGDVRGMKMLSVGRNVIHTQRSLSACGQV
jgi:hypothetical protein